MRKAGALDKKLKELANLKTATLIGCPFCIDIGSAESQEAGVTAEQVQALHEHDTSDAFSETERLVLDYAVAMSRTPLAVEDALFERLRAAFSEEQLVELTATVAWENYRSRFNHAMGIKAHGFARTACARCRRRRLTRVRNAHPARIGLPYAGLAGALALRVAPMIT